MTEKVQCIIYISFLANSVAFLYTYFLNVFIHVAEYGRYLHRLWCVQLLIIKDNSLFFCGKIKDYNWIALLLRCQSWLNKCTQINAREEGVNISSQYSVLCAIGIYFRIINIHEWPLPKYIPNEKNNKKIKNKIKHI